MRDEAMERLYYLLDDLNIQWSTRMKPADVFKNEFLTDLKADFVAVNAAGMPIARSTTLESVTRAAPDAAAYFTGKDFDTNVVNIFPKGVAAEANPGLDPAIFAPGVTAAMPIGDHTDTPPPPLATPIEVAAHDFDDKVRAILAENDHEADKHDLNRVTQPMIDKLRAEREANEARTADEKEAAALPDGTEPPQAA